MQFVDSKHNVQIVQYVTVIMNSIAHEDTQTPLHNLEHELYPVL